MLFGRVQPLLTEVLTYTETSCWIGSTASVIKRWNASMQVSWRMTSKLWDRLAKQRSKADKVPVLNVDMSAAALLIHLDASSLKTLLGMAASVLHYYQYRQYRRLRPQVRSACSKATIDNRSVRSFTAAINGMQQRTCITGHTIHTVREEVSCLP